MTTSPKGQMTLRAVEFRHLFPVADEGGTRSEIVSGDVADLLCSANSYLFSSEVVPPLHVVNDLLASGGSDLGMSGGAEWEPFQISADEFDEFIRYLATPEGQEQFFLMGAVRVADPPPEVRTQQDFLEWKIDEALKDPTHALNSPERTSTLNGRRVTFREYWQATKREKAQRRDDDQR